MPFLANQLYFAFKSLMELYNSSLPLRLGKLSMGYVDWGWRCGPGLRGSILLLTLWIIVCVLLLLLILLQAQNFRALISLLQAWTKLFSQLLWPHSNFKLVLRHTWLTCSTSYVCHLFLCKLLNMVPFLDWCYLCILRHIVIQRRWRRHCWYFLLLIL